MNFIFDTPDSPSANGRLIRDGDVRFPLSFPIDDGGRVTIRLGRDGIVSIGACIQALLEKEPEIRKEIEAAVIEITRGMYKEKT